MAVNTLKEASILASCQVVEHPTSRAKRPAHMSLNGNMALLRSCYACRAIEERMSFLHGSGNYADALARMKLPAHI